MSDKLTIKFSAKENGWLPIDVSVGDIKIEIDASDVPREPISELIEAIEKCFLNNTESKAWLYLEPNYYKWSFIPSGDVVKIKIYFVKEAYNENKEFLELEYSDTHRELLLTLWRSIKKYTSSQEGYGKALYFIENRLNEIK